MPCIAYWPMNLLFEIWKRDRCSDLWHRAWRQEKYRPNFANFCSFLIFHNSCFKITVCLWQGSKIICVQFVVILLLVVFTVFKVYISVYFVEAFVCKLWITCQPCLFIYNECIIILILVQDRWRMVEFCYRLAAQNIFLGCLWYVPLSWVKLPNVFPQNQCDKCFRYNTNYWCLSVNQGKTCYIYSM